MRKYFSQRLRTLRGEAKRSQEQLANQLGVTTQAVSKWECDLAYPDIELLMQIADIYEVTIDSLLREQEIVEDAVAAEPMVKYKTEAEESIDADVIIRDLDLPDDDTIRIIMFQGQRMVEKHALDEEIVIPVTMEQLQKRHWWLKKKEEANSISIHVEIYGNAEIDGDIAGNVHANGNVNCGDVSGNAYAGSSMECGDISGSVQCKGNLSCEDIEGSINSCAGNISCGDIEGSIKSCTGDIECGDVGGSINYTGTVNKV